MTYIFGDTEYLIVDGGFRSFGSQTGIPIDAVLEAISREYIVIAKSGLPKVTADGKLDDSQLGHRGLPALPADRANFYRAEAAGKLALAEWSMKSAEIRDRAIAALAKDLEVTLEPAWIPVPRAQRNRVLPGLWGGQVSIAATIGTMPNQPKVKVSTFRIPLDLKARAQAAADANGTTLTAIIVAALEAYVKKHGTKA